MILAIPAFRAVKESLPEAEVGVVTSTINKDVLLNNPYVDFVFWYKKKNPLSHLRLICEIRRKRFDLVIALHTVSFSFTSAMLARMSGAAIRVGSTSEPFGHSLSRALYHTELPLPNAEQLEQLNETEHNLFPLAELGIKTDDLTPVIVPGTGENAWAEALFNGLPKGDVRLLAVHPGAGKKKNVWNPEKFAEVINNVGRSHKIYVVVLEGPRDAEYVQAFCDECSQEYYVIRRRSIGVIAAVLKRVDVVLCNDTGVMHVSCAAGAETVAVFGPTDPRRWAPVCSCLHIVRAPEGDLERLQPDEVAKRVCDVLSTVG
jgi:heptosyltransferase-2